MKVPLNICPDHSSVFLVTGANGYLGSKLVSYLLNAGHLVVGMVREKSDCSTLPRERHNLRLWATDGSIADLIKCLSEHNISVVIHTATYFRAEHNSSDVVSMLNSNVTFGTMLLEAMKESNIKRFINIGTGWQNFRGDNYLPVCLYAATKQAFEDILLFYADAYKFSIVTLRFFDIYGPDDRRNKILKLLIRHIRNQESIALSPGYQQLDFVHIKDALQAIAIAVDMTRDFIRSVAFSVSSGRTFNLRQVTQIICERLEKNDPCQCGARDYRIREVMSPESPLPRLPGWAPTVDLLEGIDELVAELDCH